MKIPCIKTQSASDAWRSIQSDERSFSHAKKLINSTGKYSKEAALMLRHVSEFVTLYCAPDMLGMRLFPNAKEISESFAAFDAARYKLPTFDISDPSIALIAVGDGATPRTAATFAFRSKWACYSVDPLLRGGTKRWSAINRLTVCAQKIQSFKIKCDRAVLVAVHSHAKLSDCLPSIHARELAVIAMPCCVRLEIPGVDPVITYESRGVISPMRTIKIWHLLFDQFCTSIQKKGGCG